MTKRGVGALCEAHDAQAELGHQRQPGKEIFEFLVYDQEKRKDKNPTAFFKSLSDEEIEKLKANSTRAFFVARCMCKLHFLQPGEHLARSPGTSFEHSATPRTPLVSDSSKAANRQSGERMRYPITVPDREYFDQNIPCRTACPIHTECGRYVQAIGISKDEEAYLLARAPNPFAYVLGRICAHPCEDTCRRGKIDEPIAICALKRYATDRHNLGTGTRSGPQEAAAGAQARQADRHCGRRRVRSHLRARPGAAGVLGGSLRVGAGPGRNALSGHSALPPAAGNHQDGSGQHPGHGGHAAHARDAGARYLVRRTALEVRRGAAGHRAQQGPRAEHSRARTWRASTTASIS